MMNEIKVLPFKWLLPFMAGKQIKPKFNRKGWYYSRIEKISWAEWDNKAFIIPSDLFFEELNYLNYNFLTYEEYNAVKILSKNSQYKKIMTNAIIKEKYHRELKLINNRIKYNIKKQLTQ